MSETPRDVTSSRAVTMVVWPWREREARAAAAAREARRHARRQGLIQLVVGGTAALLLGWLVSPVAGAVVGCIAALLFLLAMASPLGAHARVSSWLARFGYVVGLALTWLLLPILYLLVFVPFGLVLRLRRRLRLTRGPEPGRATYWVERPQPAPGAQRYRRQF